jgi:hypothetical protein
MEFGNGICQVVHISSVGVMFVPEAAFDMWLHFNEANGKKKGESKGTSGILSQSSG